MPTRGNGKIMRLIKEPFLPTLRPQKLRSPSQAYTWSETHMHRFAALLLLSLSLAGCGKWPPIVDSTSDIRKLSPDVLSIRARGLADHDQHALVHLENLRTLDFTGG